MKKNTTLVAAIMVLLFMGLIFLTQGVVAGFSVKDVIQYQSSLAIGTIALIFSLILLLNFRNNYWLKAK